MNLFRNLSIVYQITFLLLFLTFTWFSVFYLFVSDISQSQLKAQAKSIVDNVNAVNSMANTHNGFWVLADVNYNGIM
jgi:hypothetical protein